MYMNNGKETMTVEAGYSSPVADIIEICSEGVLCASNQDLLNEEWD
mgnify:FL=1